MTIPFRVTLGLAVVSMLISGCGESRPDTVPVSGVVKLNGKPLPNASVNFHPEEGRAANGVTDQDGKFTLTTFETNDGAIVGNHTATVSIVSTEEVPEEIPENYDYTTAGQSEENKTEIPDTYASANTSPLKFEVKSDEENNFTLELK